MVDFQVEVEHLVKIEGVDASDGHAERVTDEIADVVIFENGGAFGEEGAFIGLLDVVLEGHESIFSGFVEEVVHHFQRIDVGFLGVLGAAEDTDYACDNLLEDVERVGDEDGADGGSADGDEFRGLDEDFEVAVLHKIAGDHTTEDYDDADN
jgi:hypothetical protein